MPKLLKQKKCKAPGCGALFTPFNSLQKWCSPDCGLKLARHNQRKERKAETRRMRQHLNSNDRSYQLKKAQEAFNKFIRLRDRNEPCISCGRYHSGQYHAGHYKTIGAHSELRFEEDNCHKQCAPCNNHKSGNITNYRPNLIEKIGIDRVAWLEGKHELTKWDIDDLKIIRRCYERKAKEIISTHKNIELANPEDMT